MAIIKWFNTYEKLIRPTQFVQKSPTTRPCCSLFHLTGNDTKQYLSIKSVKIYLAVNTVIGVIGSTY